MASTAAFWLPLPVEISCSQEECWLWWQCLDLLYCFTEHSKTGTFVFACLEVNAVLLTQGFRDNLLRKCTI